MTVIDEGRLQFDFGPSWRVLKYDDHSDYINGIQKLDSTKAVDILGILGSASIWMIEIKDFRGHATVQNRARIDSGELATEVALKLRDTIAGVVSGNRTSSTPTTWQPFARALVNTSKQAWVVLWLEDDRAQTNPHKWKAKASFLTKALRGKTKWFTTKVLVANQSIGASSIPDLSVTDMP